MNQDPESNPPPEEAPVSTPPFAAAEPADRSALADRRRLILLAGWSVALLIAYSVYQAANLAIEQVFLGVAIIVIASWPAIRWLKHQTYAFPAFETFMLTGITAYALPLMTEHSGVMAYDSGIIVQAAIAVILFQVCACASFYATRTNPSNSHFWTEPLFERDITRWLPVGIWLNAGYLYTENFTTLLPGDISSILRAFFFGLNTACLFLVGQKWGAGELETRIKHGVLVAIVCQLLLQISTLYLITSITSLAVFFLAYVSAGRKIPVIGIGLLFTAIAVLHHGKGPMREKYWLGGATRPTITQLPGYYAEWIELGIQRRDVGEESRSKNLLDRGSLLQMLCLVIDTTDRGVPLLRGETYGHILPQLVPRFFWPEKPTGEVSTRRMSIYYGLQAEDAERFTSIAFGVIAEAFANFGFWGVGILGLAIGWASKLIAIWTSRAPLLSQGGLLMILLMAWSVQIELLMSNWVASFEQAAICMLGVPFVLRHFLR